MWKSLDSFVKTTTHNTDVTREIACLMRIVAAITPERWLPAELLVPLCNAVEARVGRTRLESMVSARINEYISEHLGAHDLDHDQLVLLSIVIENYAIWRDGGPDELFLSAAFDVGRISTPPDRTPDGSPFDRLALDIARLYADDDDDDD
jgi:hypothetical protein